MSEYFTSLTKTDQDSLLHLITSVKRNGSLKFLEIGTFGGATARGIKHFCDQRGVELEYWGIDSAAHPGFNSSFQPGPPFPGAKFVLGDSAEVFMQVEDDYDAIFLDACHCFNHVILETVHYHKRVRLGGTLIYHDTGDHVQHKYRDPHGPEHHYFYNSVIAALEAIRWPWPGWEVILDRADNKEGYGGITAFGRVK